jgi:hypothetical protein
MVPRPLLREAVARHGVTAAAILYLHERSGMSESVCLRRLIYDELQGSRAAAVFHGSIVADVASHNFKLPFGRYARVPEPAISLPAASLHLVRGQRVLAVWGE